MQTPFSITHSKTSSELGAGRASGGWAPGGWLAENGLLPKSRSLRRRVRPRALSSQVTGDMLKTIFNVILLCVEENESISLLPG